MGDGARVVAAAASLLAVGCHRGASPSDATGAPALPAYWAFIHTRADAAVELGSGRRLEIDENGKRLLASVVALSPGSTRLPERTPHALIIDDEIAFVSDDGSV